MGTREQQDPDPASVVRPTPAALRGRRDPARKVRPVDYTATGSRQPDAPPDPSSTTARQGDGDVPSSAAEAPARRRRSRTVALSRPASPPPRDALHTLDADDARPLRRPLRLEESAIRRVGAEDATAEQIIEVVAVPEQAWTSDGGVSDHFARGGLVVQVRRADNAVIGVFSRGYAMAVRPDEVDASEEISELAAGRSARGGAGTRVPTTRRELLRLLESHGFVITSGSTHGRVTHPDHPGLFVPMPSTPSDVRFTRNSVSQIRRVFGIDLRD